MSYPNEEQAAVIAHLAGTLLVLAPAGTGKTRVMADRLAAVVAAGMPPGETLGVTFTNRAAEEMRRAVAHACGPSAKDCRIQTFHSLCAWILRLEARDLGLSADFVIYDEQDSTDLLRQCLGECAVGDLAADAAFWRLSQLKSDCPRTLLTLAETPEYDMAGLSAAQRRAFLAYHQRLAERHALDFTDLLYRTRAMFALLPDKQRKWAGRFRWIQIDEVQDTHLSEYEVIRQLATPVSGIAFFGDLDQTIYEWRGSQPDEVMRRITADFSPVTALPLLDNYRSTKALVRTADRHAATFARRRTQTRPAACLPPGTPPEYHHAETTDEEADWLGQRLELLLARGESGRIGILTRTHKRSLAVSRALSDRGIPHLTVEQFEFFRRQEIKDLLARLRLLSNPADSGSLQRLTQRPACGIGDATLHRLWLDGQACGLRITDLVRPATHRDGEPFHELLDALARGTVVVFDVETTGLSPQDDEVIDLGAVKLTAGRIAGQFEALLRPGRPLGASAAVHGIDEQTLLAEGRDPAEVFRDFARFAGDAVLVGHNVGFDLAMVRAHAGRLGIALPAATWHDTLDLARRLLTLERNDLATVCAHLGTTCRPSHRALADALATSDVLLLLGRPLAAGAQARRDLVARHGRPFRAFADQLTRWRGLAGSLRPAVFCERLLGESGLLDHYRPEPQRLDNLEQFVQYIGERDDLTRAPAEMLEDLTRRASLARNLDFLAADEARIPVLTIHQSKGLEFDTVFVAGVTEDEFPSYFARRDGKMEEEKRLFYVALTRAKRHLILSSHGYNDFGYEKPASRFLAGLT